MKKIRGATVCILAAIAFLLSWKISALLPSASATPNRAIPLPAVCKASLNSPRLSWEMWSDVEGGLKQKNFNVVQRASDIFAWQDFIALNWPAVKGERGVPDRDRSIGADGLRVWQTWKETSEVYLPNGAEPLPWDAPEQLPDRFAGSGDAKALFRQSKIDEILRDDFQPTKSNGALPGTLTDRSGRVVRYEIRMNRILFDYIIKHELYKSDKQALLSAIDVPDGAMLIKAAWREVSPDEENRFYSIPAYVSDVPSRSKAKYQLRKVGLVGLHVMHKTPSAPQWIWSTYEHVDNVRGDRPSFYNKTCTDCPINRQTQPGFPNQVVRMAPIPSQNPNCDRPTEAVDNVRELNRAVQKGLGDSVWRHYELINTQWPVPKDRANLIPHTTFDVRPPLLANTTMETYIQNTSSCMGCHAMARTTNKRTFVSSDFTFTFSNALPRQIDSQIVPPPAQPVTAWDRQQWNNILRGYQLSTNTYELLPEFVPQAKLHCASCHLNAGGNPRASSWFGMMQKYRYPETVNLQKRINLCFEHSLNGKPLAIAADNPNLNAFIAYMQWLDEQAQTRQISLPLSPYPPLEKLTGDAERGQKIFEQKCAFCHNVSGQGRYENGKYYRPALWGPHSFNRQAGLAQVSTMAAFLHGNMPLGSGGALTAQESWDLAAFIDRKERPARYEQMQVGR